MEGKRACKGRKEKGWDGYAPLILKSGGAYGCNLSKSDFLRADIISIFKWLCRVYSVYHRVGQRGI